MRLKYTKMLTNISLLNPNLNIVYYMTPLFTTHNLLPQHSVTLSYTLFNFLISLEPSFLKKHLLKTVPFAWLQSEDFLCHF